MSMNEADLARELAKELGAEYKDETSIIIDGSIYYTDSPIWRALLASRRETEEARNEKDDLGHIIGTCPECKGTGSVESRESDLVECSFCDGQGAIIAEEVMKRLAAILKAKEDAEARIAELTEAATGLLVLLHSLSEGKPGELPWVIKVDQAKLKLRAALKPEQGEAENKHIGTSFNDYLRETGDYDEVTRKAAERVEKAEGEAKDDDMLADAMGLLVNLSPGDLEWEKDREKLTQKYYHKIFPEEKAEVVGEEGAQS